MWEWAGNTVLTVLGAGGLGVLMAPMQCRVPKKQSPHDPCTVKVTGAFGACRHHGRAPGQRVIAVLGGPDLLHRRTCRGCREPIIFGRGDDGRPYLTCTGRRRCPTGRILLKDYVR